MFNSYGVSKKFKNNNKDDNINDSNITGKFDPSALERGASALKALDASPNAQRAFELTKLHELTRQQEIQREIQQLQLQQSEAVTQKSRIEGEERRKLLSQQQEEERITAQYKAQLDAEAYRNKLQEQKKQNEEWLELQHKQFLKQEALRKQTELDIMKIRREEAEYEKKLERENIKARVMEEAKARAFVERENFDINLKMLKEKSLEERETKLQSLRITFSSLGNSFTSLMDDKRRLYTLIGGLSALALGVYGARSGTELAKRVLERRIGKPSLVRETSRWIFVNPIRSFFSARRVADQLSRLDSIVLQPDLKQRLEWTSNSLVSAKKNKLPYRHILLYGPPGTGKTLFAKTVAKNSGMDYAIITGGDIGPLGEDGANEINKLFNWANHSKRGLILFIDEAESFLRRGRAQLGQMSENMRNALSSFLYHTGTESNKFCLILATNEKDILDPAILDRIDEKFNFELPGLEERKKMIDLFMNRYIIGPSKDSKSIVIDPNINESFNDKVARNTQGFSGRQLAKFCISLQSAFYGSGCNILSLDLAESVLNWHLSQGKNVV